MNPVSGSRGFTLLEVMLATLILGLVMAMLTLSLSGSLRVIDRTGARDALYRRARIVFERIGEDLAGAVLTGDGEFSGVSGGEVNGEKTTLLAFTSQAHVDFTGSTTGGGLARIRYSLVRDPENSGRLLLLRSDRIAVPESGEPAAGPDLLLCDRLSAVRVAYLDRNGNEQDHWQTGNNRPPVMTGRQPTLPAAVSLTLEFTGSARDEPGQGETPEPALRLSTTFVLPTALIRPREGNGA